MKIDKFGWWDLEIISADAGTQFTSTEFQEEYQTCGFRIELVALEHQEMNRQVELTCKTLHTTAHSCMVHARVFESCIHFALMYTTDHILPLLPIKDLINKDGEPTTPFKLVTGTKPSISHLRVLFCPYVVQKSTAHVGTKSLNMCHQAQKGFRGIYVGISQHQKVIFFMYHTNVRSYLRKMSFLVRFYPAHWCTRHNHIQKKFLCGLKCHTYHMLHPQRNKLVI